MLKVALYIAAGAFLFLFSADVTVNVSNATWQYHAGYEKFDLKVVLERVYYAELFAFHIR